MARKNRYCRNAKLSEADFEQIIWRYCYIDNQSQMSKNLCSFGHRVSRQTVSRFVLMLGDYYFQKYFGDGLRANKINHIDLFSVYRSLYPHESDKDLSKEFKEKIQDFQSNRLRVGVFQQFKNYSKNRKGVPLKRFCSHLGTITGKMHFGHRLSVAGGDIVRNFQEEYYFSVLSDLIECPLDPAMISSYIYSSKGNELKVSEYIGPRLVRDELFSF